MRKRSATLFLTAAFWILPYQASSILNPVEGWSATGNVYAGELPEGGAWEDEFALLCSKASTAMSLSTEELKDLAKRCDSLRPALETLEETPRKIYLKRLEKTKSLYLFVIETRRTATPTAERNQP